MIKKYDSNYLTGHYSLMLGWTVKRDSLKEEKYAYFTEVMVHPEFRRKGIAVKLFVEAEKNVKDIESAYIYVYIFEPNDASQALTEKLGWSNVGEFRLCSNLRL